ncbi:MAG: hypothetical protein JWN47_2755, partial [Frankiales bacterium]|nr:hypothetical protein [Frankiales bacterium]
MPPPSVNMRSPPNRVDACPRSGSSKANSGVAVTSTYGAKEEAGTVATAERLALRNPTSD